MPRKLTHSEVIEKFKSIHGDKYDYSKVNYSNSTVNVEIVCKTHGSFWQSPQSHFSGSGCIKCWRDTQRKDKLLGAKEVIKRFMDFHGHKYDYSRVSYVNSNQKVEIICPVHGSFFQTPHNHFKFGCLKCGAEERGDRQVMGTKEFIRRATEVHGNTYCYDKTEYVKSGSRVIIKCDIHGEFLQTPSQHLSGNGCLKCGHIKGTNKRSHTLDDFVNNARIKHGDTYDYSLAEYKNSNSIIRIICKDHGMFEQKAANHIQGQGCPVCGTNRSADFNRHSREDFIKKAKLVHGGRYDYSAVKYVNSKENVDIICRKHGVFKQSPSAHIGQNSNCPECVKEEFGWNYERFFNKCNGRDATLYVIMCSGNGESFYKIGRTSFDVNRRFKGRHLPYGFKLLYSYVGHPVDVCNQESILLSYHRQWRYKPKITFGGFTECFSEIDMDFVTHYDTAI